MYVIAIAYNQKYQKENIFQLILSLVLNSQTNWWNRKSNKQLADNGKNR